jgi:hypothetical protein
MLVYRIAMPGALDVVVIGDASCTRDGVRIGAGAEKLRGALA